MSYMNSFPMNAGGMGGDGGGQGIASSDFGAGPTPEEMNAMYAANSMGGNPNQSSMPGMFNPFQGMGGVPMNSVMQGMNHAGGSNQEDFMNAMNMNAMNAMHGTAGGSGQFVPEMDMMALFRAKEKLGMMNRTGRGASASVQDKIRAFTQEQYAKGQGLPMSHRNTNLDSGLPISSFLDGPSRGAGVKRVATDVDGAGKKEAETETTTGGGKRRKKSKKANDMPRRALSAYNIFFSEQREYILKEIDQKSKTALPEGGAKEVDETEEELDANDSQNKEDDCKVEESSEKDAADDGEDKPKVLDRTFFPTRVKRAHRKVHGKIGLVDLAREVSKRWKELEPEKRSHYQHLAEEDRKRHKEIMADYQERKAAENMVNLGGANEAGEAEAAAIGSGGDVGLDGHNNLLQSEQDVRESMAHQYQQRILAEMMASRRPGGGQDQFSRMNSFGPAAMMSSGPGGFQSAGLGMNGMQGFNMNGMQGMNMSMNPANMQDMNAMLEMQSQQRAFMLQRMRMGANMGGMMGGMDMNGNTMGNMGGMGGSSSI